MNFNVCIPKDIFAIIVLLPSFYKEDLTLKEYRYTQENIRKVKLELFNKTQNTTFELKKDKKCMFHDYKWRKRRISSKIWDSPE